MDAIILINAEAEELAAIARGLQGPESSKRLLDERRAYAEKVIGAAERREGTEL